MNIFIKNVFIWNLFLTILPFFAAINTAISEVVVAIIVIWLLFFFLYAGSCIGRKKENGDYYANKDFRYKSKKIILIAVIISMLASIYAANYYTGHDFFQVIQGFFSKNSLYNQYQKYFLNNSIGTFSVHKILPILCLFYIKITMLYVFYRLLIVEKYIGKYSVLLVIFSITPSVYFSFARGTSFEIFNVLVLLWFSCFLRLYRFNLKFNVFSKKTIFALLCLAVSAFVYNYNIAARYSFQIPTSCTTTVVCYDPHALINYLSPSLAFFSSQMAGYFTFGLAYTSSVIYDLYFLNDYSVFYIFTPFGLTQTFDSRYLCNNGFDCGVNWIPDIINAIYYFGFAVVLMIMFVVGKFSAHNLRLFKGSYFSFCSFLIVFYLFYSLISLHVGNFVFTASDNKLVICFVLFLCLVQRLIGKRVL